MSEYKVKEIKREGGVRYAVVIGEVTKFVHKDMDKAKGIAMKMNVIRRRRLLKQSN